MDRIGWKVLAIVMIVIYTVTILIVYGIYQIGVAEDRKFDECTYEICGEYPYGEYYDGICTCYDYDVLGQLQPAEYEVMD